MPATNRAAIGAIPGLATGFWAAGIYCLVLLLLFHQTAWSMVAIWLRSETFAHGFLIVPISLWLIWGKRKELGAISAEPAQWVAALSIMPACAWLIAWSVDVLVVQQLALVSMLILGVWAILGHQLTQAMAFPLLFLFLAVPMGASLIQPMMEFTATTTVWLIQQTGVPVYREGMYFSLPSGSWSVVEACSGVRYIIASFTLGLLYAYLTYRTLRKRLIFVLVSLLVPVLANTARAYIIVMLGHWSNMKIATGVDHLVYGWVFFGIVMFILFWLGAMFREDRDVIAPVAASPRPRHRAGTPAVLPLKIMAVACVSMLVPAALIYISSTSSDTDRHGVPAQGIVLPATSRDSLSALEPSWQWRPFSSVGGQSAAFYAVGDRTVGVFIQYASGTEGEGEVVGSSVRFIHGDTTRRVVGLERAEIQFAGRTVMVDQAEIMDADGEILAWSWYRTGGVDTSSDYVAKFSEAWKRLRSREQASYRIIVAGPKADSIASARELLQDFLNQRGPELDAALKSAPEEVH